MPRGMGRSGSSAITMDLGGIDRLRLSAEELTLHALQLEEDEGVQLSELVSLVLGALGAGLELVPLARERGETSLVASLDLGACGVVAQASAWLLPVDPARKTASRAWCAIFRGVAFDTASCTPSRIAANSAASMATLAAPG